MTGFFGQDNRMNWILSGRGFIRGGSQAARPESPPKIVFQTDGIQRAVIVLVKFVEFVVAFIGHEFHELTRIKFSTASEEFTAA